LKFTSLSERCQLQSLIVAGIKNKKISSPGKFEDFV